MTTDIPLVPSRNKSDTVPFIFYGNSEDASSTEVLSKLAELPHVQHPIICLPDFHYKPLLETPSSSVVLTCPHYSLSLTSPSQNCGMSLITTPFLEKDLSSSSLANLISHIKKLIPLQHHAPVLSSEEVLAALKRGAEWAIERYDLPESIANHIEHRGNLFSNCEVLSPCIEDAVPREIIEYARSRFCIIGGGNHFLEVQAIDKILDDTIAKHWGLSPGQVVIMFHTGSDALGAYLGRLYAHRRKTSLKDHFKLYLRKITFHFSRGPIFSLHRRGSYYLWPKPYRFIDPNTSEGKRALIAINSAANFGFANRAAIFNAVRSAVQDTFASGDIKLDLLYDCSHNSIYQENVNGKTVWSHRHNACRVYPPSLLEEHPIFAQTGQPVILPGTNQTSSFICAGREGAVATHFTVDHGLGAIQHNHEQHAPTILSGEFSNLFNYEKETSEKTPLLPDTAINRALDTLNRSDIIKTVARLKPLATLKGPKAKFI